MMLPIKSLMILSSLLALSACATPDPITITETKFIEKDIPVPPRPEAVNLADVDFSVITAENLDEFLEANTESEGSLVFVAITVRGYENLSLNTAELKRYIEQQQAIIVYYERQLVSDK